MRRLLLLYGLGMSTVVLLAFLVPLGLLSRSLAADRALDAARADAQRVAAFAADESATARLAAELDAANSGAARTTSVVLPDGTVVGPAVAPSAAVELAALGRAVTAETTGGIEVLVPVAGAAGTTVVRTFVPDAELTAGVRDTWLALAGVGAVLLGATALAGDRIARRLARSVQDLAGVADRLGSGDLAARVVPSGPPEVVSVGRVLNGLGARVGGLLAAERELVADLSHRLRTPITALRLDVDLLEDAAERERMAAHVDDLVVAVDDVVRTARRADSQAPVPTCDAAEVVAARARFWAVLASAQGRELQLDVDGGPAPVGVGPAALGAAVDVLVDNVFGHTPSGTAFGVAVRVVGDVVQVTAHDDGPGLPGGDVVERGRSGAGSTGLGLDVARRTAETAGGRLVVGASPTGGGQVTLEFPCV